jgi:hypothetical protein
MDDARAENFVSVETLRGNASWRLGRANDMSRHPWNRGIELELLSGEVLSAETLTVTLGGTAPGCPGYRAQSFAEPCFRFRLGVDALGQGRWEVLPEDACPPIEVIGNRPASLRAVVSGVTGGAEQLSISLKLEDVYGNVAGEGVGDVGLLLDDSIPLGGTSLVAERASRVRLPMPESRDWRRITAASDCGAYFARSNPFGPSPMKGFNLYFGDLHVMSGHCCGTGSAAAQYAYAAEVAGLDFAAVTSLDLQMGEGDWAEIRNATRKAHVPGRFVTFLGYEWGGTSDRGGDHCIYFPDDKGRLVRSGSVGDPAWNRAAGVAKRSRNLVETIQEFRDRSVMVVPHCGGRRCNLDFFDPAVMPMLEIHSCHRTFEDAALEAIRRGIRCGFIANSDDHRGAPGDSHPTARERFFSSHGGLAAVYAKELTRESLWEAFFARRVYATNGSRLALTTKVGSTPMGGEVFAPVGTPLEFSFWTCLDGFLDRVEVMSDGALIRTFYAGGNQVHEFSGECQVSVAESPHAYYVRVYETDGGKAWSSPIWVNPSDRD